MFKKSPNLEFTSYTTINVRYYFDGGTSFLILADEKYESIFQHCTGGRCIFERERHTYEEILNIHGYSMVVISEQ